MNAETEYRRLLESRGIPLRDLGLADIALNRADALLAVNLLRSAEIPVLGGDVYIKTGKGIEVAYANWHSDRAVGEDRHRFVMRSCLDTETYIKNFPTTEEEAIFVLVIESRIADGP